MIRRTAMRQACVQVNVFENNDTVFNIREGLYTENGGKDMQGTSRLKLGDTYKTRA
jgi:hypothetical protein